MKCFVFEFICLPCKIPVLQNGSAGIFTCIKKKKSIYNFGMWEYNKNMNIAVVGGGASGMVCAIECARRGQKVTLFEKNTRVGKKLSATGGGRCNILNSDLVASRYNDAAFAEKIFALAPKRRLEDFLNGTGLFLTAPDEAGRIYPLTESAATVIDCLRFSLEKEGVKTRFERVETISKTAGKFFVVCADGHCEEFDKVVLACGSGSQAETPHIERFVQTEYLTDLQPSLTPLKVDNAIKGISGVRVKALASLYSEGKLLGRQQGEIQFRDFGLSGIMIFDLSAIIARDRVKGIFKNYFVEVDFLPFISMERLAQEISERISNGVSKENIFLGLLQKKLAEQIVRRSKRFTVADLVNSAKKHIFTNATTMPFAMSQTTCGGVDVNRLDDGLALPDGLIVIGEALNVDGVCGGYNLAFAIASAIVAAEKI